MAITVALSAGLRAFITDGLQRGRPPAALIDSLIGNNFEPRIAKAVVDVFVNAQTAGIEPPEHRVNLDIDAPPYQYETPRFAMGNVIHAAGRTIRVLQRLQSPVVATLEGVLTETECEQLIDKARPRLQRSTVVDSPTGTNVAVERRNSDGMFFRLREDPFIAQLDERLAAIMNGPPENSEGLQVLHYRAGGVYPPHFDFLVPSNPAVAHSIARSGQRVSTLIVYLNDVVAGGETVFPEAGFAVVPRRGNGLYFEYTNSRMQVDPRSAHGGAPVMQGEKWIVTKWMRSQKYVLGETAR
jgi:prolyl 4-hydroxylase